MYGINAFACIAFCAINVLAYTLCKGGMKYRRWILPLLCTMLLGVNGIRYAFVFPFVEKRVQIPVEFSTVAYFTVPVILLLGKERFKSWAAYSGLMAGFFYYLAMIVAGGPLYDAYAPCDVYISLFCHGALYFCGFVTIATTPFDQKEGRKLALGVALVAGRAALLRPLADSGERLFIYILLDGICVKRLLPECVWHIFLPAYYGLMLGLILLSIRGFFQSSARQYQKFSPTAIDAGSKPCPAVL